MANKRRCPNCESYNKPGDAVKIQMSYFCDLECAAQHAYKNKDKGKKIKHREQKRTFRENDIKIRKEAAKKACHAYIRERDKNDGCICCGRHLGKNYDAGHFLESGNNSFLRFHEDNIHAQSVYCNQYKGGNSDDYVGRLRVKIGNAKVNWLLDNKGGVIKRTAKDYKEIEIYYKQKLKELSA